jgi:hypothetical protein
MAADVCGGKKQEEKTMKTCLLCLVALVAYWGSAPAETIFHAALTGNDVAPGTRSRPFATLDRASQVMRMAGSDNVRRVLVHDGRYELGATFTLGRPDSGTSARPVIWQAAPGESVRLVGGMSVPASAWRVISEPPVLARLDPIPRGQMV